MTTPSQLLRKIRILIVFFMIMLAISGITAFPVEAELRWLLGFKRYMPDGLSTWLIQVYEGVQETNDKHSFLMYGFDWLAFAHVMFAVLFIGPYKNPVKNIWVVEWGIIACICIVPLALIAGPIRGIPLFWQLIDSSFGIIGTIPLWICRRWIKKLESIQD